MKILYVVSLFPCWSETFIVREINALKKNGVDISILSLKNPIEKLVQTDTMSLNEDVVYPSNSVVTFFNGLKAFIKKPFVNIKQLYRIVLSLYKKPLSMLKSIATWWLTLSVIERIKCLDVDHIHAHWATYPSTSALILSSNLDIPFSFTSHAHDIFLEDHLLKEKLTESKFSVTISKYNKERLTKQLNLNLESKLHVVHCGIDIEDHKFLPDNRDTKMILAVGRLDYIKGFSVLIDACKFFKSSDSNFKCNIIGSGPLESVLQQQIIDNNLENYVELVGVMPQEEIKTYLAKSNLFVLPSVVTKEGDMDGIPVALMEAMAVGIPVVSTTVSGIPELIDNHVNGLIVKPNDPLALSTAMLEIINNTELSKEFSINARSTIESEFSIYKEADKLHSLFKKSLNEKS